MNSQLLNHKKIITCAITGAGTRPEQTPHLPITPEQIANSAIEAAEAGAVIAHIHVRQIHTGRPSMSLDLYKEVIDRIKEKNEKLIINLTTGPGAYFRPNINDPSLADPSTRMLIASERVKHIEILKPDICTIDFNTMNTENGGVRINQLLNCKEMLYRIQSVGTLAELEFFDSGDLLMATELNEQGLIHKNSIWQLALGIKYGWTATPATMHYAVNLLPKNVKNWSAFGVGKSHFPIVALSLAYGGHIRVGLEDNIYISKGILAKTNAELVTKAKLIVESLGHEIATIDEARKILEL